jgi:hypothetical protein
MRIGFEGNRSCPWTAPAAKNVAAEQRKHSNAFFMVRDASEQLFQADENPTLIAFHVLFNSGVHVLDCSRAKDGYGGYPIPESRDPPSLRAA